MPHTMPKDVYWTRRPKFSDGRSLKDWMIPRIATSSNNPLSQARAAHRQKVDAEIAKAARAAKRKAAIDVVVGVAVEPEKPKRVRKSRAKPKTEEASA